jgi:hypothetical protein
MQRRPGRQHGSAGAAARTSALRMHGEHRIYMFINVPAVILKQQREYTSAHATSGILATLPCPRRAPSPYFLSSICAIHHPIYKQSILQWQRDSFEQIGSSTGAHTGCVMCRLKSGAQSGCTRAL